jgi:hypothetical protein
VDTARKSPESQTDTNLTEVTNQILDMLEGMALDREYVKVTLLIGHLILILNFIERADQIEVILGESLSKLLCKILKGDLNDAGQLLFGFKFEARGLEYSFSGLRWTLQM